MKRVKKLGLKEKYTLITFLALLGVFLVLVGQFFIPVVREFFAGFLLFLLPSIIFSLVGVALIVSTVKEKVKGLLKIFLLLTGSSAIGFFVAILLHNLFYALGIIISHVPALYYLMQAVHVTFFFIATLVCPIGFIIGAVGSIFLGIKKLNK